ncbi:MAG: hypothetical protein HeimC2_05870 [Candidatus Heimdallarchaeota archaeon LC_2]|nr:MAG: hypothetical protein HeimC2_05870 [Candidatus Heimdallarchaeota archaeon LC_2]
MDSKFCTTCGNRNEKNAKFCSKCGNPISVSRVVRPDTEIGTKDDQPPSETRQPSQESFQQNSSQYYNDSVPQSIDFGQPPPHRSIDQSSPSATYFGFQMEFWVYISITILFYIYFLVDLINFQFRFPNASESLFWVSNSRISMDNLTLNQYDCTYFQPNFLGYMLWKSSSVLVALAYRMYRASKGVDMVAPDRGSESNSAERLNYKKLNLVRISIIIIIFSYANLVRYIWYSRGGYFEYTGTVLVLEWGIPFLAFPILWFALLTSNGSRLYAYNRSRDHFGRYLIPEAGKYRLRFILLLVADIVVTLVVLVYPPCATKIQI